MAVAVHNTTSGNWSTATWLPHAPTAVDAVTITAGTTIQLNVNYTSNSAMVVNGDLQMGSASSPATSVTLTITNTITVAAGGTLESNPSVTALCFISAGGNVTINGTGILNLSHSSTSICDLTITNTATIGGTSASVTLNTLFIAAAGKVVTMGITPAIDSTVNVYAGTLACGAHNMTANAGSAVNSGTITFSTGIFTVPDSLTNNTTGTITITGAGGLAVTHDIDNIGAGKIQYTVAGVASTLSARNIYNAGTITGLSTATTLSGSLYNAGTFTYTTGVVTVADSVTNNNGKTIQFSSGTLDAHLGDINNSGTITYTAAGTLKAINFYNTSTGVLTGLTSTATVSGELYNANTLAAGAITFTTGTLNVTDSITNKSGCLIKITGVAGTINATGDINNSGAITYTATGVLKAKRFYNTSTGTVTGLTSTASFTDLYNDNSITFTTGIINVSDSVTNNSGKTITFTAAGAAALNVTKDINNSGTISFTGGASVLGANNFYNTSTGTLTGTTATTTITGSLYNSSTTAGSITYSTGAINVTDSVLNKSGCTIDFTGAGTLNATGDINNSGTITFGGAGVLKANNFYNTSTATLTANTSTATIGGNLYNSSTTAGSITFTTGTLNVTDSTVNATGATIKFSSGKFLATGDINNTGAITYSVGGTLTANNLFVNSPSATLTGLTTAATMAGNVTIGSGATLSFSTGTMKIAGNYVDNGTFTYGTGTVNFNGTGAQKISGTAAQPLNFYNLTIAGTGSTVTLGDSILINRTLTFQGGTTGTLDVSTNDYHVICKFGLTNNESTTAFNGEKGRVFFIGAQTLGGTSSTTFNDIRVENGALTVTSPETVLDTFDLVTNGAAGNLVNASPNTLSIGNAFLNNTAVAFASNTGIIQFTGNTNVSNYIGGTAGITIQNLTSNLTHGTDTLFMQRAMTVSKILTITSGVFHCQSNILTGGATSLVMGSTGTLVLGLKSSAVNVALPVYPTYTLDPASTIIYQALNALQRIVITPTYGNLDVYIGGAGAITKTFNVAGTLNVAGSLTIGNAIATGVVTLNWANSIINVTGNTTINTDGKLLGGTGAYSFNGNFTNNGVFTVGANTTTFGGSVLQSIGGSTTTSFNNVVINGYDVIITQNENALGTFVINGSKTFDCGSTRQVMTVTGAFTNSGTFVGDNGILALKSNFTNNSTFTANTGMVTFEGSGAQTVGGTTSCQFYDFTVNCSAVGNTVTLNTAQSFTDSVCMQKGTLAASPSSLEMTLVSTSAATGRIGMILTPANVSITAKFNVQRYESARGTKPNYVALSSPVATTLGDWNTSNQTFPNVLYMSGVGGPNGTGANNYVSVFKVDETKSSTNSACYVPITSYTTPGINYVIQPGDGIYLWLGSSLTTMFDPFTYVQHGLPTVGTVNYTTPIGKDAGGLNGFNVIGNPFASSISWSKFTSDNPGLSLGAQYYLVENTGAWVGTASDTIPMCQGFGIAAGAAGTAHFNEDQKISGNPLLDGPILPGSISNNNVTFRLSDDVNPYSTPVTIKFGPGYTKNFDLNQDAYYIISKTEGIPVLYTTSADNTKAEFKTLPDSEWVQEIPLTAIGQVAALNTLTMQGSITEYECVNLIDRSTGIVLNNFNINPNYKFATTSAGQEQDFILQFAKLSQGQTCQTISNVTTINLLPVNVNVLPDEDGAEIRFSLTKPTDAIISVYNIVGEKVSEITTNAYDNTVQLNLAPGQIYIIKVQTTEGLVVKKLFH
jgi:hypothetical protein